MMTLGEALDRQRIAYMLRRHALAANDWAKLKRADRVCQFWNRLVTAKISTALGA